MEQTWVLLFTGIPMIILLLFWVVTLIYQARRKEWAWFIITLILWIAPIFYWVVFAIDSKPKRKKKRK